VSGTFCAAVWWLICQSLGPVDPILIIGATGTQGGAVASVLLASGRTVRALVRDPAAPRAVALQSAGAELVTGDLMEPASLIRAFAAVEAVYAVTTPFVSGPADEERQGTNIVVAAQETQVPWLLLASVASANRAAVPHFASKARIERQLAETDLAWTVIAPSYFYENVLSARESLSRGVLPSAVPPDRRLQQVALADLGAVVDAILDRRKEHVGVRVEIAGDDPTPAEMAAALAVRYEPLAIEAIQNSDLAAMYRFLAAEGYDIDVEAVRARYPEVAWTQFADWARGARPLNS